MHIALIADTFPPLRSSGAVQLRDLSREFVRQGHILTVILPSADMTQPLQLEQLEGVQILRLHAAPTKEIGYVRRTLNEFFMPFSMLKNLRKSPLAKQKWDGIIWYSPSIFHGPLVNALKQASRCKSYLILRDIFPEWAVDMGLMGRGLPYRFFDAIARYQYSIADVIGVQTHGNLSYFKSWAMGDGRQLEVLQNWLADTPPTHPCSINLSQTSLASRKIFVYAGNMGIAQGMDILLTLAERMRHRSDIGFLFVGRGSHADTIAKFANARGLDNILFRDEIHPDEVPALYAQCHVGLVALDPRHKSHNIPGKFLSYMQCGLPVLANINAGNDLAALIRAEGIGEVSEHGTIDLLEQLAIKLINNLEEDPEIQNRCRNLYHRLFSPVTAARQIVAALSGGKGETK